MPARRRPTVVVVGAGRAGALHVEAARALGAPLLGVVARTAASARPLADAAEVPAHGLDALPAADVVVVATPPGTHLEVAVAALARGSSVLVEQPFTATLASAATLVAAAGPSGVGVASADHLAHAPLVRRLLQRLPALGPLSHLSASAVQAHPRSAGAGTAGWGGGALVDLGPAVVAVVLLAARPACVVAVRAELVAAPGAPAGVDEHAELALRFDDGLVARAVASWRGGGAPRWDVQAASPTGVLRGELLPAPLLEHDGEPVPLPPPRAAAAALDAYGYLGQLAAVLEDHEARRAPFCDATFGRAVLEVLTAAAASAASGVEVPLPWAGRTDLTPGALWGGRRAP